MTICSKSAFVLGRGAAASIFSRKIPEGSQPFYIGSIISVVGKSTVEIMEPFLV